MKYPQSKILYLTPLPTSNVPRDEFNKKLGGMLIENFKLNTRIEVVDVGNKMRENPNWLTEYLSEGLHQSPKGVQLMAEMIDAKIKSEK